MLQSKKDRAKGEAAHSSVGSIQKQFFRSQLVLIITLALILGLAGSLINLHFEKGQHIRINLQLAHKDYCSMEVKAYVNKK